MTITLAVVRVPTCLRLLTRNIWRLPVSCQDFAFTPHDQQKLLQIFSYFRQQLARTIGLGHVGIATGRERLALVTAQGIRGDGNNGDAFVVGIGSDGGL